MTKFWATLSNDILHILTNGLEEFNVVIEVGEAPNTQTFHAHSIILRARSPYFRQALSKNWARKERDVIKFSKPNISPKVFEIILKFIYSGTVNLMDKTMMEALDLLIATDELLLTELSDHVQEYLLHYEVGWLEDNLITLWRKINQYESCRKLQEYCLSLICKDPNFLFKSPDFLSLDSSLLVPFLKLDNLQIGEDGRLCRVSRHRSCYAIRFNGRDYGPCFGDKDLSMKGKFDQEGSCSCQKDDYFDKVTDTGSFKVDEYEVFKIVKK
ncbi:16114_t:CDS:2 [Funneliformis mosseae]|uniref:16114_t:CDS:1 n=1 Tax=Funneliformis mosseae TaxID=27381 RepID=A0A9N9EV02_FUNMO|nr:16114_t:CDS:2 [Funneliformis mosseae]